MEKETKVVEAQIVETFNVPEVTSLKLTESLKRDIKGSKGDFMEKQIRKIDRELNDFDILGSKVRGAAANHNEVHVATPFKDMSTNVSGEAKNGHEVGASHVDYLKPKTSGTKEKIQLDTQASSAGRVCKGDS